MNKKKVLYISYDGMTDPLGQSQVLPYLKGLSNEGYHFTLLSFEKKDCYQQLGKKIKGFCDDLNIDWVPLSFTPYPPLLSKAWDLFRLKRKVKALHQEKNFDLVHCRSYVSAEGGLFLKQKFGVKFLFDIRGFWVDERVDGGLWNLKNPFYKALYKFYKAKEKKFFYYADHVISLTDASISYLIEDQSINDQNITVIPCASDFELFRMVNKDQKLRSRKALGIENGNLVISYLGSIGTWYLLDEMLLFFKHVKEKYPRAIFLFITPEIPTKILSRGRYFQIDTKSLIIRKAHRNEVSKLMSASDLSVYFIKQCFSKISSSPTKLGEILAMGLPVITNTKIGDVADTISKNKNGFLIDDFTDQSFKKATDEIDQLLKLSANEIRSEAAKRYQLTIAIDKYVSCYKKLFDE